MTPAQREQLNRFLAERVCKWIYFDYLKGYCPYDNCKHSEVIKAKNWNPLEKWADCEPLLNKIEQDKWKWDWDNFDDRYTFKIMKDCANGPNENSLVFHASEPVRTESLGLAIAKAYNYKEDDDASAK